MLLRQSQRNDILRKTVTKPTLFKFETIGVQKSRKEECVNFLRGKFETVDERYCQGATKPRQQFRVCNEHPCPIW